MANQHKSSKCCFTSYVISSSFGVVCCVSISAVCDLRKKKRFKKVGAGEDP